MTTTNRDYRIGVSVSMSVEDVRYIDEVTRQLKKMHPKKAPYKPKRGQAIASLIAHAKATGYAPVPPI